MTKYTILTATSATDLSALVMAALKEGWDLYGEPQMHVWDNGLQGIYMQAMIQVDE